MAAFLASVIRAPAMLALVSMARIEVRATSLVLDAAIASESTVVAVDARHDVRQVDRVRSGHRHQQADRALGRQGVLDRGVLPRACAGAGVLGRGERSRAQAERNQGQQAGGEGPSHGTGGSGHR